MNIVAQMCAIAVMLVIMYFYVSQKKIILHTSRAFVEVWIAGLLSLFFDIFSTKAKQFGFTMLLPNGVKFTCCGDEPYNEKDYEFVKGSDWLTHEAFCLYGEADKFKPYEKHHSTVKEACQLAEELQIPHLILYHTEEMHLKERKELYTREGREYYHGKLFVPDDLEVFEL